MILSSDPTSIELQLYQIDLLCPLNNWKEMLAYPLPIEFKKAVQEEWNIIMKRKTYKKMPATECHNITKKQFYNSNFLSSGYSLVF
jgi:hypothetical protein